MNRIEDVIDNFNIVFNTKEKVQELRNLILDLAVRGKLVPQDPNDEPASVLLEKIEAEKKRLIKEGKLIGRNRSIPAINNDDLPFELPKTWKWVRLGHIGEIVGGGTPKTKVEKYWVKGDVPWLTPADLNGIKSKYISCGRRNITELGLEKSSAKLLPKGSVLLSSRAPIGYVAIARNKLATNQGFKSCVPFIISMNEYIYYFLMYDAKRINKNASGTTFNEVSGKDVSRFLLPLPPLEEQIRIVKRIDNFMTLCDHLEISLEKKEQYNQLVSKGLSNIIQTSKDQEELISNFRKLVNNFKEVYKNSDSIQDLKNTILHLAVRGKLVPQEADDEPASELLKKIEVEKKRLIKEKEIRKINLKSIKKEEILYELPEGWGWARIGDIILDIYGGGTPRKSNPSYWNGNIPWASVKDFGDDDIYLNTTQDSISKKGLEHSSTKIVKAKDVIICTRMGLGRIVISKIDVAINQDLKGVKLSSMIDKKYFYYLYKSLQIEGTGTTVKGIRQDTLLKLVVAIPPLNEQKRIVERLDYLISLCDRLNGRFREKDKYGEQLIESLIKF